MKGLKAVVLFIVRRLPSHYFRWADGQLCKPRILAELHMHCHRHDDLEGLVSMVVELSSTVAVTPRNTIGALLAYWRLGIT